MFGKGSEDGERRRRRTLWLVKKVERGKMEDDEGTVRKEVTIRVTSRPGRGEVEEEMEEYILDRRMLERTP